MRLTTEERRKLHAALTKVAHFLDEKIVPQMCGTQITVDFGEMQTYCSAPYREKQFHLTVYPNGYGMRSGGLGGLHLPPSGDYEVYEYNAGLALLKEWPSVKRQLEDHIDGLRATKKLLDNFTV